jgi:hypothetical protein
MALHLATIFEGIFLPGIRHVRSRPYYENSFKINPGLYLGRTTKKNLVFFLLLLLLLLAFSEKKAAIIGSQKASL